jgi:XTP/dITP diphosphohydrolase
MRRVADVPAELDTAAVGTITEDEWRACWPSDDEAGPEPEPDTEESAADDVDASCDGPEKD